MAADATKILAGVSAGAGNALVSVAPVGTTLPTTAVATLNVAFKNLGWISTDGITKSVDVETEEIGAFGASGAVRVLKTSATTTMQFSALESNPTVIEVYNELPLNSITVDDEDGTFNFVEGPLRTQRYAMVIDMIDGDNHIRGVAPLVEVTDKDDLSISGGAAIEYNMTVTAYPGGDGTSIHWYYVVASLIVTP